MKGYKPCKKRSIEILGYKSGHKTATMYCPSAYAAYRLSGAVHKAFVLRMESSTANFTRNSGLTTIQHRAIFVIDSPRMRKNSIRSRSKGVRCL